MARTVIGRDRFALFAGGYHGIFKRGPGQPRRSSGAAGHPEIIVGQVEVLEYGADSALTYLSEHGFELAAVLVEPVQSRQPELQPRELLHAVRRLPEASDTPPGLATRW